MILCSSQYFCTLFPNQIHSVHGSIKHILIPSRSMSLIKSADLGSVCALNILQHEKANPPISRVTLRARSICVVKCDLESIPRGVTFREPINMARDIPGASRSITSLVA